MGNHDSDGLGNEINVPLTIYQGDVCDLKEKMLAEEEPGRVSPRLQKLQASPTALQCAQPAETIYLPLKNRKDLKNSQGRSMNHPPDHTHHRVQISVGS